MKLLGADIRPGDTWHDEDGTALYVLRTLFYPRTRQMSIQVSAGPQADPEWVMLTTTSEQEVDRPPWNL